MATTSAASLKRRHFLHTAVVTGLAGTPHAAPGVTILETSADAADTDHGYPSTVELQDGTLLTVWYEVPKDRSPAVLRQAHWQISR